MDIRTVIKQKTYEKIEHTLRRHPLTFVPIILLFLLMLIAPLGAYFLIYEMFPQLLTTESLLYPVAVLMASMYCLVTYIFFYVRFIDYYLDVWIVTNDRLLDIEQHGLFNRVVTELDLYRIQDVTANITGVVGTLFHYGDVVVTTASANTTIVFRNVPDPNYVREELIRLADLDRLHHYGAIKAQDENLKHIVME